MAKKKNQNDNIEQDSQGVVDVSVDREDFNAFWKSKKNDAIITDILKEYGMSEGTISTSTKQSLMNIIKSRRR